MPALARYRPQEWKPGPQFQSDEELARLAGDIGTTIFHPVGTCRMGRDDDPMAVLDARLRVRGVAACGWPTPSAMPTITSGNTNCADADDRRATHPAYIATRGGPSATGPRHIGPGLGRPFRPLITRCADSPGAPLRQLPCPSTPNSACPRHLDPGPARQPGQAVVADGRGRDQPERHRTADRVRHGARRRGDEGRQLLALRLEGAGAERAAGHHLPRHARGRGDHLRDGAACGLPAGGRAGAAVAARRPARPADGPPGAALSLDAWAAHSAGLFDC
jgi:hypothetical protein